MQTFKDEQGRIWQLKATSNALKRIQEQTQINLLTLLEDKSIVAKALSDYGQFVGMLWAWCEPQADKFGVTPEQFAEDIYGDAYDASLHAFQKELPLYFPPQRRIVVEEMIRQIHQAEEAATNRVTKLLGSQQMQELMTRNLDRAEATAIAEVTRIIGGDSSTS